MLQACLIEVQEGGKKEDVVHRLRTQYAPLLVLDTCQRLETYGYALPCDPDIRIREVWDESGALLRLARIAAGLQSRILGELEILGQVRLAYKHFQLHSGQKHTALDRLFQDALAIARKARKISGIDSNLTSLGGLAAREMIDALGSETPVAVVGAGSLARSVTRYLNKRGRMPVRIASRCPDNALRLAAEYGGFASGMDDLAHLFTDVGGIICATAAPHPVVYPEHLEHARAPVKIIDLGEPADCAPDLLALPNVHYTSLLDIESRAECNNGERVAAAERAEQIIEQAISSLHALRVHG